MEIYICAQFVADRTRGRVLFHYSTLCIIICCMFCLSFSREILFSHSHSRSLSFSVFKVYLEYKPNKAHIFILELIDLYWILNLL